MWDFGPTRGAIALLLLAFKRLLAAMNYDIRSVAVITLARLGIRRRPPQDNATSRPHQEATPRESVAGGVKDITIFASACEGPEQGGGGKYSGGIKELNLLINLLVSRGYEAYMVTYDGTFSPWLVSHAPHIGIDKFAELVRERSNVRCVTSWATAKAFIKHSPKVHFWDMELRYTTRDHFLPLYRLNRKKLAGAAAISRTVQAWQMSTFGSPCGLIPNLLDTALWKPAAERRQPNRVGFMGEGGGTQAAIDAIRSETTAAGLQFEFVLVEGDEQEVLDKLQTCDFFLSLNPGKDALWGEGCPRTILEAMAAGAVVLGYDIVGNRETLVGNFNGIMAADRDPLCLAKQLIRLAGNREEAERLRHNAQDLIDATHTFEARMPAIARFLDL